MLSYTYVLCTHKARDIVHEVFFEIMLKQRVSDISNLKGYLWVSVKNSSLKQARKVKKIVPLNEETLALPAKEEVERLPLDHQIRLQEAVGRLPERCKSVFELCALDGEKYHEAADSLGISVNTVKTQMKKAYKVLRHDLKSMCFLFLLFI